MAKNKKPQPAPKLSPENYIRQKARNLEIHECLINCNWKETKTAYIIVSRKHMNGNYTTAAFIIDLYCLGVAETYYSFNSDEAEYEELKDALKKDFESEYISYNLAHNIIYSALAYADEFGFKPDKDFTTITQFVLEEDTDDIELIDIKCGDENGKPVYIVSQSHSAAKQAQILKQLEKAVGEGNYTFYDDASYESDSDDEENEFIGMPLEEQKELFLEMSKNGLDEMEDNERLKVIDLTDNIYLELCDAKEVDRLIKKWEPETLITIKNDDHFSNEYLGIDLSISITTEERHEFNDTFNLILEEPKIGKKSLDKLRKKWGNIPYICFCELTIMRLLNDAKFENKLDEYCNLYPNYPYLRLMKFFYDAIDLYEESKEHIPNFSRIFIDRKSIDMNEMIHYQTEKLMCILRHGKMEELDAMYDQLNDVNIDNDSFKYLKTLLLLQRIKLLQEYFGKEK